MRRIPMLSLLFSATLIHAQQCEWLTSVSIDHDLNPSMPTEVMATGISFSSSVSLP